MREMKVRREGDRVICFLRLFDDSRIDLSFDRSSRIVLMSFKDYISKMSFKEFKEFVKVLKNCIKYIEDSEEGI